MGISLAIAQIYVPQVVQKRKLEDLFRATAAAFRYPAPDIDGLNLSESLIRYARFTRERAGEAIQQCREPEVKYRLFQKAFQIGQDLRDDFHIKNTDEVMQMGQVVYKILGIDFQGNAQGEIVIRRCFFSSFYSSRICQLISALDAGLLAGLSSGGELKFSQRITEGKSNCLAKLIQ